MGLLRMIRSMWPRFEPRTHSVEGLGEFTNDPYGNWLATVFFEPVGRNVDVLFQTGAQPPGAAEVAAFRRIADAWPSLWPAALARLEAELSSTGATAEAASFVRSVRPIAFVFHGSGREPGEWEIVVDPSEWSEHCLTVIMRGFEYGDYRLDG